MLTMIARTKRFTLAFIKSSNSYYLFSPNSTYGPGHYVHQEYGNKEAEEIIGLPHWEQCCEQFKELSEVAEYLNKNSKISNLDLFLKKSSQ